MSPLGRICPDCGEILVMDELCSCPEAQGRRAHDQARRMAKPQRVIWDSPRWHRLRRLIWKRDGFRCVDCGRHRSELKPNELLIADHTRGLTTILDEGGDPFDPAELETRCSRCSGRRDGGRGRPSKRLD